MADRRYKGRVRVGDHSGEHNGRAKLTATQVANIRERFAAGESAKALANEFKMSDHHILRIVQGKQWKNAPGPITPSNAPPRHYLTEAQAQEIARRYWTEDISQMELAKEYGVSQAAIGRVVRIYKPKDTPLIIVKAKK